MPHIFKTGVVPAPPAAHLSASRAGKSSSCSGWFRISSRHLPRSRSSPATAEISRLPSLALPADAACGRVSSCLPSGHVAYPSAVPDLFRSTIPWPLSFMAQTPLADNAEDRSALQNRNRVLRCGFYGKGAPCGRFVVSIARRVGYIAWTYLQRSGELDHSDAARFLTDTIERMIHYGHRNRIFLANKAISKCRKSRPDVVPVREPA